MIFIFPQKIWDTRYRGKFGLNPSRDAKKLCPPEVSAVYGFFWVFDRDLAGSTKKCPLYSMSPKDSFDCISAKSSVLEYAPLKFSEIYRSIPQNIRHKLAWKIRIQISLVFYGIRIYLFSVCILDFVHETFTFSCCPLLQQNWAFGFDYIKEDRCILYHKK